MSQVKQTPIYGNWQMLSPEGVLMCRCDDKRANWYLRRGLAEDLGDNRIRLTFTPDGLGNTDAPFLLEEKENVCVVCGSTDGLNRHHIVPYQYRKHFPHRQKANTSYDVVPICVDHHHEYEEHAQVFATQLGFEYNAPFNVVRKLNEEQVRLCKALKTAHLLLTPKKHSQIPSERLEELRQQVAGYMGLPATDEAMRELIATHPYPTPQKENASHAELVVAQVLEGGLDGLHEFIKRWRRHFIETMKPQFLSETWDIEYMRI